MAVRERNDGYRLYYPETGAIASILALSLLYYLVAILTPVLVVTLQPVAPGLVPEPLRTGGAAVLWLALAGTVFGLLFGRIGVSRHDFPRREDVAAFARSNRPSPVSVLLYALGTGVGAGVVFVGNEHVTPAFTDAIQYVLDVTGGDPSPIPLVGFFWLLAFLVGFWLLAIALDRLLVDAARILAAARLG